MNEAKMDDLKEEIKVFYLQIFKRLSEKHNIQNYDQLLALWREFQTAYFSTSEGILREWSEKFSLEDFIDNKIESDSAVVEVIDQNTGRLFRRIVPLSYLETDNGIILSGENTESQPAQIAFLSDTALNKIIDVTGKGRNTQRCEE